MVCFGFGVLVFFLLVIVVWIGEGVLQIITCLSGFSLRKAGQGKEYTMQLERKVLRLATHLTLGEPVVKPQALTTMLTSLWQGPGSPSSSSCSGNLLDTIPGLSLASREMWTRTSTPEEEGV